VQLAPKPIVLYSFNSQKVVEQWHVFTDSFFGGKSQASLSYNQAEQVRLWLLLLLLLLIQACRAWATGS
jgi:hypothetical protein